MIPILNALEIINNSVEEYEGARRYLSTGNLNISHIEKFENYIFEEKPSRANLNVQYDDLILARMKGTNKVLKIDQNISDIIVSTGFLVLRCKNELLPQFLFHILKSKNFQIRKDKYCSGATQKAINNTNFSKLNIPLPPLETQKRIAAILDDAAALRDKTQQLLIEYDQLAQSIFLEMFGDPGTNTKKFQTRQLNEFYISKKDGTKCGPFGGALKKHEFVEEGIAVWNMDNIEKNGELNSEIKLWITEEKYSSLEAYNVVDNDIIISRAGTVGKMTVVNSSYSKSIISTNLIRLRLDSSKLLPIFFSKMMNYFKERVGRLKTGAEDSFTHMNTGVLNNLKFPYPPIELQYQFANKIDLIEQQKELAKKELQESEDLFNCLLQKAFKGELE